MPHVNKKALLAVDAVIREAITDLINHTNLSFDSYTARVTAHYFSVVPLPQRTFALTEPNAQNDAWECNRANSRKLARLLSVQNNLHMPAVLIPSLIASLDEPFRSDTTTRVFDLISLQGKAPATDGDPLEALQFLMKEQSEALQAFLQVAKGGFDDDSTTDLFNARVQLLQAVEAGERALGVLNIELEKRNVVGVR